jgi:hypothetical protein
VLVVVLGVELAAGELHLVGVDDHHEVTGVHVWRVLRVVLAAENRGDARAEPPEGDVRGIDHEPFPLYFRGVDAVSRHGESRENPSMGPGEGRLI